MIMLEKFVKDHQVQLLENEDSFILYEYFIDFNHFWMKSVKFHRISSLSPTIHFSFCVSPCQQ